MTNVRTLTSQDRRYEEASLWIAKIDRKLTPADMRALRNWTAADPKNTEVLADMARLWDKMDVLSRLSDLFPVISTPCQPRSSRHAWAVAASVLLAVAVGIWAIVELSPVELLWQVPSRVSASTDSTYETAVGEQSTVTLPDGTRIVLNTNSLLHVDYTPEQRLLTLARGEISVRVAKDPDRILSVLAGTQLVQAIGTEFNIEISDDQTIELVVTEGMVRVGVHRPNTGTTESSKVAPLSQSSPMVSAGEKLVLGTPEEEITSVTPEEIDVKLSWRDGNLIFRGESLEEAVHEIGRYTSVEFVFLDDDLKKVRVAGLFKAGDVDGLLAALRTNFNIVYQRIDDQTVVLDSE